MGKGAVIYNGMDYYKFIVLGLISGIFSSSLGIGAGGIIVPVLILFLGKDIKKAIGISLTVIVPIVFVSLLAHIFVKTGDIDLKTALMLSIGSVVGAIAGSIAVKHIEAKRLSRIFAFVLVFIGINLMYSIKQEIAISIPVPMEGLLVGIGMAAGVSSSMFGIGGGMVIIPSLSILCAMPMSSIVPVSLIVVLVTTITGSILHNSRGKRDHAMVKKMFFGALAGAVIGACIVKYIPNNTLKAGFSLYVFWASFRIWWVNKDQSV